MSGPPESPCNEENIHMVTYGLKMHKETFELTRKAQQVTPNLKKTTIESYKVYITTTSSTIISCTDHKIPVKR